MPRRRAVRNAGAAVAQVTVSGLMLFLLYRYLLQTVGVERMGVWSVVLATTSAARITELGFTGSVVKFVARHLANEDSGRAGLAVETAALSLGAFVGVVLLAAYLPAAWVLGRLLPATALPEGLAILPYAMLSLWIMTLAGIFQSALDGCQRTDLRAAFTTLNSVLYLLLAMPLVPAFGLLGLAYVQVGLSALLLLLCWLFLRRELRGLPLLPRRWSQPDFREMLSYGFSIQVATLLQLLNDPVTKALLAKFGGLAMVGYYEMASRMIMQLRGVVTAPKQIVVPIVARLHETDAESIQHLYRDTYRLQSYIAIPFYAAIVAALPPVSRLWIGHVEPVFVLFACLLAVGWFLNGFVNPAYYVNLGTGRLRWNTAAHAAIGILNVALGLGIGFAFGGVGVVAAWVLALVLGSAVVLAAFHREYGIPGKWALPRDDAWLFLTCLLGIAAAWGGLPLLGPSMSPIVSLAAAATIFTAIVALPLWLHPMRQRVLGMLRSARSS